MRVAAGILGVILSLLYLSCGGPGNPFDGSQTIDTTETSTEDGDTAEEGTTDAVEDDTETGPDATEAGDDPYESEPVESEDTTLWLGGVLVEVSGEGSVTAVEGGSTHPGEYCLSASPEDGWYFSRWEGDVSGTESEIWIENVTSQKIIAVFERNTVVVTILIEGGGTVELSSSSVIEPYDGDLPIIDGDTGPNPVSISRWNLFSGDDFVITPIAEEGWFYQGFEITKMGTDDSSESQEENPLRIELCADADMEIRLRFVRYDWTILLYVNGDNELESQALEDINECEAGFDPDAGIRVLALIDRGPGHDFSDGDWMGTRVYQIQPDPWGLDAVIRSPLVDVPELGLSTSYDQELNTGIPSVLSSFVTFGYREYPARHTALILWGHGSGWRSVPVSASKGIGLDETDGSDQLLISEIRTAFMNIEKENPSSRITVLGFDSCFSALFEVAYELRTHVDYLVGSQGIVSDDGWEYDRVLEELSVYAHDGGVTPEDLMHAVVGTYGERYSAVSARTISAVRMDSIEGLNTRFNEFCDDVYTLCAQPDSRDYLRDGILTRVTGFYLTPGDLFIDLVSLVEFVQDSYPDVFDSGQSVIEIATRSIVEQWCSTNIDHAVHGLSIMYTSLDRYGYPLDIPLEYWQGYYVSDTIQFPQYSRWSPVYPEGPGLLFRLWYEDLESPSGR